MQRQKSYHRVVFSPSAIEAFVDELNSIAEDPSKTEFTLLTVYKADEHWDYDTLEEFIAEIRGEFESARLWVSNPDIRLVIEIHQPDMFRVPTSVSIEAQSRETILRLANIVDEFAEKCFIPERPKPKQKLKIFIGHGGSTQWRELKDHLQDQHDLDVIAYETGSRAGHAVRDIIVKMLDESSFAILVMTGEDIMENGSVRPRQNVIHELGLFQGRLGFEKAIVLLEYDTEEFSNIFGVHQIRFSKDNIKATFGDVLAVLSGKFGDIR